MTNGRGAWSHIGKDNGSALYEYIPGAPLDGSTPSKSNAYQAVNLGVKAIQKQLNKTATSATLTVDGHYGPKTAAAVIAFQNAQLLKADGRAGATTCIALWHQLIHDTVTAYPAVQARYLYGQMLHESSADPGACGYYHEADRGLVQINTEMEPVSTIQAHDPGFALPYAAQRFSDALTKYAWKGEQLQLQCAILAHNSPAGANSLYRTGEYANSTLNNYVNAVLEAAKGWVG